jgi:hypothetical protein
VAEGDNALRPGIAAVSARLENGTLRVLEGRCPNLLAEAALYRYSDDPAERQAEVPVDEHNHAAGWHASKRFLARVEEVNSRKYRRAHGTPRVGLAPLPARAQFLNVIESVFNGLAGSVIHNSDYASVDEAKAAIDRYFAERDAFFRENPKRAGGKIWGKERVPNAFREGRVSTGSVPADCPAAGTRGLGQGHRGSAGARRPEGVPRPRRVFPSKRHLNAHILSLLYQRTCNSGTDCAGIVRRAVGYLAAPILAQTVR